MMVCTFGTSFLLLTLPATSRLDHWCFQDVVRTVPRHRYGDTPCYHGRLIVIIASQSLSGMISSRKSTSLV
ncbi:hypothetical protein BDR03DRAFT_951392 [Suillus americanus]|nr:hypothetical protein BDR03DRAFT_951392 [Suillus americanus]